MEEDLDLRLYVRALCKRWWWIIGLGLLAGALAFAASSLTPSRYEASSMVVVSQPRYPLQFDPRVTTTQPTPPYKAYLKLATSDGVLQAVVDGYRSLPEAAGTTMDLATLSSMAKASSASDPSLLELKIQAGSPQLSAAVANLWANVLVKNGSSFYNDSAQNVSYIQDQATEAQQALDDANQALAEYQARSQVGTLTTQLMVQQQAQKEYLSTQITVTNIIRDVQGLRGQLAKGLTSQSVSQADGLTALLLQMRAFNAGNTLPIQLQINSSQSTSSMSRQEQLAFLDGLAATLQDRLAQGQGELAALEPAILALQGKLQEARAELDNLKLRQSLASEIYTTVARTLSAAEIADHDGSAVLRVGSYANTPLTPVSPRPLRTGALAVAVGLMLSVLTVFALEWLKA